MTKSVLQILQTVEDSFQWMETCSHPAKEWQSVVKERDLLKELYSRMQSLVPIFVRLMDKTQKEQQQIFSLFPKDMIEEGKWANYLEILSQTTSSENSKQFLWLFTKLFQVFLLYREQLVSFFETVLDKSDESKNFDIVFKNFEWKAGALLFMSIGKQPPAAYYLEDEKEHRLVHVETGTTDSISLEDPTVRVHYMMLGDFSDSSQRYALWVSRHLYFFVSIKFSPWPCACTLCALEGKEDLCDKLMSVKL